MIHGLDNAINLMLDDASRPEIVRNADVSFDRPSEAYIPGNSTINLFLYDLRENTDLRNNEPSIERRNGTATISRPPIRMNCSYLVTAWIEAGVPGDEAILKQHELLAEVLRVFSSMATIDAKYLQGELLQQPYPIPLTTLQGDLNRNPAEFWAALGGKLRPSFTLTATVALMPSAEPLTVPLVSSGKLVVASKKPDVAEKDGKLEEATLRLGGKVTASVSGLVIPGVTVKLPDLGKFAETDEYGQFVFGGIPAGPYKLQFSKIGFVSKDLTVQVPGSSPTAFDVALTTATP